MDNWTMKPLDYSNLDNELDLARQAVHELSQRPWGRNINLKLEWECRILDIQTLKVKQNERRRTAQV